MERHNAKHQVQTKNVPHDVIAWEDREGELYTRHKKLALNMTTVTNIFFPFLTFFAQPIRWRY